MQAVILAGGLGRRMAPLTDAKPKCLLPVLDQPFAAWQIELLASEGVRKLVFCIGHLGEEVKHTLGDGSKWGVQIAYSEEGERLLGTAGAIRKAASLLEKRFFLLYGDSYLLLDYEKIWRSFEEAEGLLGMMVVLRNFDQLEKSNIHVESGFVKAYDKTGKTPGMTFVNEGLSVIQKEALSLIPTDVPDTQEAFFERMIRQKKLGAYETTQRFYEIGSPAGLKELETYLRGKKRVRSQ